MLGVHWLWPSHWPSLGRLQWTSASVQLAYVNSCESVCSLTSRVLLHLIYRNLSCWFTRASKRTCGWSAYSLFRWQVRRLQAAIQACTMLPIRLVSARIHTAPGFAIARTMVVLALYVLAEPMIVPARCAIASGCTCARRVLAEPMVICAPRMSNPRCDPLPCAWACHDMDDRAC